MWDDAITVGVWTPKSFESFENGACGKGCQHMESLGVGGDLLCNGSYVVPWDCQHGSWLMAAEAPAGWVSGGASRESKLEFDSAEVAANCVAWLAPHRESLSFGDLCFLEEMEFLAAETPEARAARKAAEALRDAKDAEAVIGNKVARKEEKWTNHGAMKFRVPRPCRYASLFEQRVCANCSAAVPVGQSSCSASIVMVEEQERRRDGRMAGTGKMVARLASSGAVGVRMCGQALVGCWNHEQHHTCIYVHPDEPQWAAANAGTLRVKEDNRLIFCMVGQERSAASVAAAASASRFAALSGGGNPPHGQQQRGGGQQRQGGGGGRQGGGGAAPANTWVRK